MGGCLRLWGTQRLEGTIYGGLVATILVAPNPQSTKVFLEEIFNKFYDRATGIPTREISCLIIGYPNYLYVFDPGSNKEVKIHDLQFGFLPETVLSAKTSIASTVTDSKFYCALTDHLTAKQAQCLDIKDSQNPWTGALND